MLFSCACDAPRTAPLHPAEQSAPCTAILTRPRLHLRPPYKNTEIQIDNSVIESSADDPSDASPHRSLDFVYCSPGQTPGRSCHCSLTDNEVHPFDRHFSSFFCPLPSLQTPKFLLFECSLHSSNFGESAWITCPWNDDLQEKNFGLFGRGEINSTPFCANKMNAPCSSPQINFCNKKKGKERKNCYIWLSEFFPNASSSSISSPHFPIVLYSPRCCKSSIWLFERWMIIIIRIPLGKKANLLCGIVNTGSKELKKAGECCFFSASFHEFCNISCLGQESTSTRTRPLQKSCRNNNSNCLWPMNGLQQWNFPIILGSYLELDDHVRNQLFDRHLLSYHWNVNLIRAGAVKVSFLVLTRRKNCSSRESEFQVKHSSAT